jgi:uracil-DNA glycosylase
MLTPKQMRMLELLDQKVEKCSNCGLKINGTAIPHWTPYAQYAIIGEAPGANEVREQTPFIGPAGQILTEQLNKAGFNSRDFLSLTRFNVDLLGVIPMVNQMRLR